MPGRFAAAAAAARGRAVLVAAQLLSLALMTYGCASPASRADRANTGAEPPPPLYEYRGAWVATAFNFDWPSQRGLTVEQQKEEVRQMLNVARALKINVIYLQVRAAGNRIYAATQPGFDEPWSRSVTLDGQLGGKMPKDYDPLQVWIDGCHARGIELHAWVNPFRANARKPATNPPRWTPYQGGWFDPGDRPTREWIAKLIGSLFDKNLIITRAAADYDLDGVGVDHYAYPDPTTQPTSQPVAAAAPRTTGVRDFPDNETYEKYGQPAGLKKNEWRRKNLDDFMQGLHSVVKSAKMKDTNKPQPKFTISPMAINNAKLDAEDAPYSGRYEDPKRWLAEGWCDVMVPEVYTPTDHAKHPFKKTLQDWVKSNKEGDTLIVAGLDTTRVAHPDDPWSNAEIAEQIRIARDVGADGHVHFSLRTLAQRPDLVGYLKRTVYQQAALVPGGDTKSKPATPTGVKVTRDANGGGVTVQWNEQPDQKARLRMFTVYYKIGGAWRSETVGTDFADWKNRIRLRATGKDKGKSITDVRVAAVRKDGVESERARPRM
jgi:uncharacterized lipoprotein YddW (UPF0748 family)